MDFKFTCSILSAYILSIYQYPDLAKYAALTSSGLRIIVFSREKTDLIIWKYFLGGYRADSLRIRTLLNVVLLFNNDSAHYKQ